ncbi:STAS domain-containing protein [Micromonospora sp. DT31]|uniref:STAS domain-containing protein n=1 Tax=Micromonospora sp. DT31 TaxID=3393434 RepID=UPI003CEF9E74
MRGRHEDTVHGHHPPAGPGITRLAVTGEVEMSTSDGLRELIANALAAEGLRELIVYLDAVQFLDSTGIAALVAGHNTATQRGVTYRIVNPRHMVREVLDITGVLPTLTDPRPPA